MKVNQTNMKNVQAYNYYDNIQKKLSKGKNSVFSLDDYANDNKIKNKDTFNVVEKKEGFDRAYGEYYKQFYNISTSFARDAIKKNKEEKKIPIGSVMEEMGSTFSKIRNDILDNFNGSDKENRLKALSDSYDNAVKDNIAAPFAKSFWYAQGGSLLTTQTMTSEKELKTRGVSTNDVKKIYDNINNIAHMKKLSYEGTDGFDDLPYKVENEGQLGKWNLNQLSVALDISRNKVDNVKEALLEGGFKKDSINFLENYTK